MYNVVNDRRVYEPKTKFEPKIFAIQMKRSNQLSYAHVSQAGSLFNIKILNLKSYNI